jgi:DNA polymerase
MTSKLYIDLETYSPVPITHGTHAYAENAEVMLFAYALDDAPVQVWDCTSGVDMPDDLAAYFSRLRYYTPDFEIVAHNAGGFDRIVLERCMGLHFPLGNWRDTLIKARSLALPAGLADLCEALNVPVDQQKDARGKRLVHLFCKPAPKNHKVQRHTRETNPAEWAEFVDYARLDVEAMRACDKRMADWNYARGKPEHDLWMLDQRINDVGVAVDLKLVRGALHTIRETQIRLRRQTLELTRGEVETATQVAALLAHIGDEYGVTLPDLRQSTVNAALADERLPQSLHDLLTVRLATATTSTAKYKALRDALSPDGRLHGMFAFDGASRTGRWTSKIVQLHNLPRPTLAQADIDLGIRAIKADCADLTHEVMPLMSSAIRGALIPSPGNRLVVADLSNIEGRVLAWLAGEAWKVAAFRAFDACKGLDGREYTGAQIAEATLAGRKLPLQRNSKGEPIRLGDDIYKLTYARTFGVDVTHVTKAQRQVGKVQELAFQYQGGVSATLTYATLFGIDVPTFAQQLDTTLDAAFIKGAESYLRWAKANHRARYGLADFEFTRLDAMKLAWRDRHPAIETLWGDVDRATRLAITHPGVTTEAGKLIRIRRDGHWLRVRLPSGRFLCYPGVRIDAGQISYMGVDPIVHKWTRLRTYAGKLVENITQAVARDVLADGMRRAEQDGYRIVLHIHDEIGADEPQGTSHTAEHLAAVMSINSAWSSGLPLAAAGFEADRYRKD